MKENEDFCLEKQKISDCMGKSILFEPVSLALIYYLK